MKRILSLLLAVFLILSLVSCSLKLPADNPSTGTTNSTESDIPTSSDKPTVPDPTDPIPTSPDPTEPKEETPTAPVEDYFDVDLNSIQTLENINFSVSSKWSKSSNSYGLYYFFEDGCMLYISVSEDEPTLSDRLYFQAYYSGIFSEGGVFSGASILNETSLTILGGTAKLWRAKHSLDSQPYESCLLVFRYSSKVFSFICTSYGSLSDKDERFFLQVVDTISPAEFERPTDPEPTGPNPTEPEPTEPKPTEPEPTQPTPSSPTTSQQSALKSANRYLSVMAFSRSGLIKQLEFEGFSTDDATYAVDNCGADWMAQAVKKALNYLDTMAFSRSGLIKQLEYEGFTSEQAAHGVDNCGADWMAQAVRKAKSYLDMMSFSRSKLINQLEYDGFTPEQAAYGADQNGL